MVNIDQSLFIQIINFLLLIWILNMVLYKPIRNILNQRKEKVCGLEQSITTLGQEATQQSNVYEVRIRDARSKGKKKKEAIMEAVDAQEKAILDKIDVKTQADLAEVKSKIANDVEQVGNALQNQVDDFAAAIVQKILGRTV
jgi:F-type H+-transporting ATPase subunit b